MKKNFKPPKPSQLQKMRYRFTIGFFTIVFVFFFITIALFLFLASQGVSIYTLFNPTTSTIIIAILCLVLGYVASYYVMNQIFSPLDQLSEASKKVAKGNYDIKLTYDGNIEELETMIQNFNLMTRELNSVEIMRNDFIANVSHEFKTPLTSITGYVTLLQDPDLSEEERKDYIHMTFFNIEKLNDLTSNILQLSKLENQMYIPEPVTYRLDEQIREAIVLLEPKWSSKNILLDINLPEVIYTGQKAMLFQVWTNILGNAIKFSNINDEIQVSLTYNTSDVQVLISDNGIGMTEETLSHIFEKFYQGDSSRQAQGNGLGLALCKQIIDRCNGRIYVSSEPGKGSTFMITLNI